MQKPYRFSDTQLLFPLLCLLLLSSCARPVEEAALIFYPPPPERPRLQFLTAISSETDLAVKRDAFDSFLFGPDLSFSAIGRPYDIASNRGNIYLIDRQSNKILTIDLVNKDFTELRATGRGALRSPSGIWVTPDGFKYIADIKRQQIVTFNSSNEFIRAYGNKELFNKPVDVAVYNNNIYVCDMVKSQIIVLDRDSGEVVMTVGESGSEEGQLHKPTHVTVDNHGNVFVNDAFNFRVQQFDSSGVFVKTFGFHGDRMGGMARSKGLDVDQEGNLYVADAAFEYVQIFNKDGQLLLFFGGPGNAPGNMYLPAGVHIDYENIQFFNTFADPNFKLKYLLYVCNMSGSNKVNVYGYGDWSGE